MSSIGPLCTLAHAEWQVPAFHHVELREKRSAICVCVPVINEGARIQAQLARMAPLFSTLDIVIADGGSSDGSVDAEYLRERGVRALLTKAGPGRLSAQMRMAMAWGLERGYAGLVFIDGNNKDDPGAIPSFVQALDEGWDHVQGSRYMPGGRGLNTPMSRHFGVKLLHAPLISLAAGFRYTDTTNGFRAYSQRLLLDPRVQPFRDVFFAYELHYYLAIRAARLGFRVKEIATTREYPRGERTPTKISPLKGNLKLLKTLFHAAFVGYNPPSSGE